MNRIAAALAPCARAARAPAAAPMSAVCVRGISAQALNRAMEVDMPMRGLAENLAAPFAPFLDRLVEENCRVPGKKQASEEAPIWVPAVARAFPGTARLADSEVIRNILIHDPKKAKKPRLSWYNPYDTTWVPSGWFTEGLMADMKYYYGDVMPQQAKKV